MLRYFIVDDDLASRSMLKNIIVDSGLGMVIGEASNGQDALSMIQALQPDLVLIDLLMPDLDGIETIEQLKKEEFNGQFVMISQVVNKEMVGEAYGAGVEFFIHKPINRMEVESVLRKTSEQSRLKDSLLTIQASLAHLNAPRKTVIRRSIRDEVLAILSELGIVGEAGSEDIVTIIKWLMEQQEYSVQLPSLKELYEAVAVKYGFQDEHIQKESKAIEQRIRRAIVAAMHHLASLGVVDYTIREFEYYAPRFFDFQEIRNQMIQIEDDSLIPSKTKVNNKKFLQALYLEVVDKIRQAH